jgi:peptide/nickel transport system substrate-binding protein
MQPRRTRRMSFVALGAVALILAAGTTAGAQSSSPSTAAPVVLRVGTTIDLITANPFGVAAGSDYGVAGLQYDLLQNFSSGDLTPAPGIAKSCTSSTDAMTWTCDIRQGVKWSDGTPLTARDVAFTFRFALDNHIPQYRNYLPFHPTFETPDDHTLIWKAQEPTFAPNVPPWIYIVPENLWKSVDGKGLQAIKAVKNVPSVGTGPFTLTSWDKGRGWVMDRNPNFWGPAPTVDRIEYHLYSNQEAMIQALRNGQVDFIDGVQPSLDPSVKSLPHVTVQQVISDWWLNLAFNFGGQGPDAHPLPALQDLTVRRAIEMAIDKKTIAEKVYAGTATPGDTVIRPASTYWHLDIPADQEFPYSPDDANKMLDQAGYLDTNGDGIREDPNTGEPLKMLIPASTDTTGASEAGQLIVGYLKAIGIAVDLRPVTDAKMNDYWGTGNFDAYIWYWGGDPDPDYQLSVFTSGECGGWSDGCYKDPTFDKLYEEQRRTIDQTARLKIVQEAQRRLYEQVPGVVLAYPGWLEAYRNDRFTGWTPAPGPHGYLMPGYNYESLLTVHPVSASGANTGSSGIPAWVLLVVVIAIVALSWALVRRGRRRSLDEI